LPTPCTWIHDVLLSAAQADYAVGNFSLSYENAKSAATVQREPDESSYELCAKSLWQLNRVEEALAVVDLVPGACVRTKGRILLHCRCLREIDRFLSDLENRREISSCQTWVMEVEALIADLMQQELVSPWGVRLRLSLVKLWLFPSHTDFRTEEGRRNWTAKALSQTQQLRKLDKNGWEVLHWHSVALLRAGFREDALNGLHCASQLPDGAESDSLLRVLCKSHQRFREGEAAAAENSWAMALRCFEDAEVCSMSDPDLFAMLLTEKAQAKLMLKRSREALEDIGNGLKLVAASAKLYFLRGKIHMDLEMYALAAQDFGTVLEMDPGMPELGELHDRALRWARYPPVPDHYAALSLSMGATNKDIKKAYRLAALRWHPDKNAGSEAVAEQVFKQIQAAFNTLSDESSRKAYDAYPGDRQPFVLPASDPHHSEEGT